MLALNISIGTRFGRLTVINFAFGGKNGRYYACACDCGNTITVRGTDIMACKTQSCGCFRSQDMVRRKTIHGHSPSIVCTSTYRSWASMLQRCGNPNNPKFSYYGGRGILVCDKWKVFKGFLEEMGAKQSNDFTIERLDPNKGYNKDNCMWLPKSRQASNRRNTIFLTFRGITKTMADWAREYGIKYLVLRTRIVEYGWSAEKALTFKKKKHYLGSIDAV